MATCGYVQFKSGEPRDSSGTVAFDTTDALYPRHGSIGPHDAERDIPCVSRRVRLFVEKSEHCLAIALMDPAEPLLEAGRFVGREPIQPTKSLVPIDVIGVWDSHPRPRCRGVEHQTQPLLALPKRCFGTRSFGGRPHAFGRSLNQRDLVACPVTRCQAIDAERRHQSSFLAE